MSGSRERWLAAVGLALTPGCLAALASSVSFAPQAFALAQRGTRYGSLLIGAGVVAGLALVLLAEIARRRLRVGASPARAALIAGLCWAYLLLPLAHYLVGTDGWFYITTADNFFPASWWMLALGWLAAAAVATLVRHPGQPAR